MFKVAKDTDARQHGFVHQAVKAGVRLDCRKPSESRQVSFSLTRDEAHSEAVVSLGNTKAVCVVRGELGRPYPDRPTEGTLQFNAKTSVRAEAVGQSAGDLTRALERVLRESDCLDLESLCVVAGVSAWAIVCDLVLIDYDGNAADACVLAALAALRAFRRPEVSAVSGVGLAGEEAWRAGTVVKVHSAEERDPLPLALHQTPLTVTVSLFKDALSERDPVLVADPTAPEEAAQSGSIVYTFNAHSELCGMYKSGEGCGLRAPCVVAGSVLAAACAGRMHAQLDAALESLERRCEQERADRLTQLRARRYSAWAGGAEYVDSGSGPDQLEHSAAGGIDRNDPILSYGNVHSEVFTRE